MKAVIAGGSGQVGQIFARHFAKRGDDVVILCRSAKVPTGRVVMWDGRTLAGWSKEVDGAGVVINLAGRSVNCRYTEANLRAMLDSRVDSTLVVGKAIAAAARPPPLWLQMSTATIYANRFDAPNRESDGILGGDEPDVPAYWARSVNIAKAWESALTTADTPLTRRVAMRTSMVMSPDEGGIFDVMLGLVRHGLGGNAGTGEQYVSWIHDVDLTAAIDFLIGHEELRGVVNLASPHPLPYAAFMHALRDASGTRIGLPATKWMLELGAWAMRTDTELVLKSRRVVPQRLLDAGFSFQFGEWPAAARDLVTRWRHLNH